VGLALQVRDNAILIEQGAYLQELSGYVYSITCVPG